MELELMLISATLFILFLLLPPILDGLERKIKAKVQSRIGPPTVLQTWYDILKLLSKELRIPRGSELVQAMVLALLLTVVYLTFVVSLAVVYNNVSVDVLITIAILIIATHTLFIAISLSTSNPFALIGSFRAIALSIVNEVGFLVSLALTLYTVYAFCSSPSPNKAIALTIAISMLLLSCYVSSGRLPYDIHEAEPELASGALIELSGPILGLYLYSHYIERFVMVLMPSHLLARALILRGSYLLHISLTVLLAVVLYLLYGLISALLGRTRIDLGIRFLISFYIVATISWVIVWGYTA